jgi:hypothetical protein
MSTPTAVQRGASLHLGPKKTITTETKCGKKFITFNAKMASVNTSKWVAELGKKSVALQRSSLYPYQH